MCIKHLTLLKIWAVGLNIDVLDEYNIVPSCTMTKVIALAFMKDLLLVKCMRLEIWSMENRVWKLAKQASPGNLLVASNDSSVLGCGGLTP